MSASFCHSCGMPLDVMGAKGRVENYCAYCTDEQGSLKAWDEVLAGTAQFLASWQPGVTPAMARERAQRFLSAMPAWADRAG